MNRYDVETGYEGTIEESENGDYILFSDHLDAIQEIRDKYEAEIARLKATTWQPVADGDAIIPKRSLYKGLGVDGDRLYITQTNGAKDSIYLTDNLRLCEKVQP